MTGVKATQSSTTARDRKQPSRVSIIPYKNAGCSAAHHALDAAAIPQSVQVLRQTVAPGGIVDFVLPNDPDVSPAVYSTTSVVSVHNQPELEDNEALGFVMSRYFTRALQDKSFSGHPFEIRPGGLAGVEQALRDSKDGKAGAIKYISRISETPGCA